MNNLASIGKVVSKAVSSAADAKLLTYEEMKAELERKPQLILLDVRELAELETEGKIEQAKNIPVGELTAAFVLHEAAFKAKYGFSKPSLKSTDDIVVLCKAGTRAQAGAKVLKEIGFKNVRVYAGMDDWKSHGGAIVK